MFDPERKSLDYYEFLALLQTLFYLESFELKEEQSKEMVKAYDSLNLNCTKEGIAFENFTRFIFFLNGLRPNPEADAGFRGDKKPIGQVLCHSHLWVIDKYAYP